MDPTKRQRPLIELAKKKARPHLSARFKPLVPANSNTELMDHCGVDHAAQTMEAIMGFGRGALLWLIGIPLPIILLLALFMHH